MSATAPKPSTPAPTHSSTAAANPDSNAAATTDHTEWTESQYVAALALLETLHDRIDSLRQTVPTLIRGLATAPSTPELLFKQFQRNTLGPSKAMVGLQKAWESKETREIMSRAEWSFGRKIDLPEGRRDYFVPVPRFGWVEQLEEEEKEAKSKKRKFGDIEGDGAEEEGWWYEDEEMERKVKVWKEKHEDVVLAEWDKEEQAIKVGYVLLWINPKPILLKMLTKTNRLRLNLQQRRSPSQ